MHHALLLQAKGCLTLGSVMYGDLFKQLAQDYVEQGIVARTLGGSTSTPLHDATPLRLAGALHKVVLDGLDDDLAKHYPSVGGVVGDRFTATFLEAIVRHQDAVQDGLQRHVQTNEVGRSVVPLAILHWLGWRGIAEVNWWEIGASAGLNLAFDSFGADTGKGIMGDCDSAVFFPPDWFDVAPPVCPTPARVTSRHGVDLSPIDITDPDQVARLLSFIWPDQDQRFKRTNAAIDIASKSAHNVDMASADVWLEEKLVAKRRGATIVFHSIVWQYLGRATQDRLRTALTQAGTIATPDEPLIWARMEPAGNAADVRVTIWDGISKQEVVLATVGYHGQHMRWL